MELVPKPENVGTPTFLNDDKLDLFRAVMDKIEKILTLTSDP
ncbi:hypothetical protein LEP1GSC193_2059 [Leptospira alstonii serovar Pingchang str. 80-412]|uniref:Uncharacterized protein n=2 Tax=Leptospira alstonii TaxID=28452 RepID=M6DC97_9LEPT|nr:hypothetical protein LEP1GSC194_0538 [Leptospira alstonii serovar Sichuan str. 79601]EQA79948.1 hypothetical protein LEP1GSC193_2059 [Leptospira alstonii serovar Pingchang str. 80-412]